MSEVAKMYENAGIEPIAEYCKHQCNNEFDDDMCIGCKYIEKVEYPPFTAEKQLLLLQLLARIDSADYFQFFFYEIKQEWVFRLNMLTELSCESAYIYESRNKNFDECIAGLINIIWQDLTEEEKQEIKRILT